MKPYSLKSALLGLVALMVSVTARAQFDNTFVNSYEEPFVVDHDAPHYEYHLDTGGASWDIGKPGVGYGSMLLESVPKGAKVYIDDVYQGQTPLLIDNVPDGTYSARFEYNGYINYYVTVNVAARLQSHVTAGMMPRDKQFFDKREAYTTLVYEHSGVNAGNWGVGNSWGVYIRNFNLEQSTLVHIGVLNTVAFEGALGYGFMFGHFNRYRITPQIGYSGVWFDNVGNAKSYWTGYLRGGLNFKCAFTEQYAFSMTLLYDKTGPGIRAGVLFFVN